jgi:hypothetical protein
MPSINTDRSLTVSKFTVGTVDIPFAVIARLAIFLEKGRNALDVGPDSIPEFVRPTHTNQSPHNYHFIRKSPR